MNLTTITPSAMDLARRLLRHPVSLLGLVGVLCTLLGVVQFAVALALLSPADFAVIGVLMATGAVVANFVDARTIDLTTRLYYAVPEAQVRARGDVLAAGATLQAVLGLLAALLTVPALLLAAPRLVERPVAGWWIGVVAFTVAAQFLGNALTAYLRLLGAFRVFGLARLALQTLSTVLTILLLLVQPSLDGYFLALWITNAVSLAGALALSASTSRAVLGVSLLRQPSWDALRKHVGSIRFLASGSLNGFAKMLSRSGDVLVVAALTNDVVTGTYRVARQAADALFGLSDALHQFYGPTIVAALSRGDIGAFRKLRSRLLVLGLLAAGGAVLAAVIVLDPLAAALIPRHREAVLPFAILAGLLVVSIGVSGWLWPALVTQGRIGRFSLLALAGGLVQLSAMAVLWRFGRLDATSAAAAAWAGVGVTYGPLLVVRAARRIAARAST